MAYSFDQVFAADPANPANIAQNASIKIFAPGDATETPIAITDTSGTPIPNPVTVNANGFGPAFMSDLDRVAWAGGGFTGFFTSYEGMKQVAVDAQAAAENAAATAGADAAAIADAAIAGATDEATAAKTAAQNAATAATASANSAANAAALVGAPADTAIAAAVNGTGTATKAALNATFAPKSGSTEYAGNYGNLVIGDGDSITQASVDSTNHIFADSWYTYMTILSDGRLPYTHNAGHGGWTSAQLLAVLDAEVIAKLPEGGQCVWAAGRNDAQNIDLTRAADIEVVRRLRQAGINPILATIPPVDNLDLATPAAPTTATATTGGTLAAGTYTYTVVAKNGNGVTLPSAGTAATTTGTTSSVVITWPYQAGTTGWDIYRDNLKIGSTANHYDIKFTDTGQAAAGAPPASNTTGEVAVAADVLHTARVNAWRKHYAAQQGITCLDFYDVLADPATGRYKQGYSFDGVHPSQVAQRVMGKAAWDALSPRVANSKGYIAEDQADPLNIYTNGLFLVGGGNPVDRPNGFASLPTTGYVATLGPLAGFKGNAWSVERTSAAAAAYFGTSSILTGWTVGDVLQFSCKYQRSGEATGLVSEIGVRFTGTAPSNHLGFWRISGDVAEPARLVSPQLAIPAGTTQLQLTNFLYGGTGKVSVGQFTVVNLTTGRVLS